jgi:hypothetical protein
MAPTLQASLSALTRCLEEEAAAIAAAAQRLDAGQVELALRQLEACRQRRAKLVITGVGKSGIVARKIAATFSSTPWMPCMEIWGLSMPTMWPCCSPTAAKPRSCWQSFPT